MIDTLYKYYCVSEPFLFDEKWAAIALVEVMQVMEADDNRLVADILKYDFVEYLQELLVEFSK